MSTATAPAPRPVRTIPTIEASPEEIYDIELEHSLLEANAKIAGENRAVLDNHGITAIDFMGGDRVGQKPRSLPGWLRS